MQYLGWCMHFFPPDLQLDSDSQVTPLAAFISDEGKKVLPFLNRQTQGDNDIAQRGLWSHYPNILFPQGALYWIEPPD